MTKRKHERTFVLSFPEAILEAPALLKQWCLGSYTPTNLQVATGSGVDRKRVARIKRGELDPTDEEDRRLTAYFAVRPPRTFRELARELTRARRALQRGHPELVLRSNGRAASTASRREAD